MQNKLIWKSPLSLTPVQTLELPKGSKVLSTHWQLDNVSIWYEVPDERAEKEQRHFAIIGTGHSMNVAGEFKFIGTVLQASGQYVWHVYEVVNV